MVGGKFNLPRDTVGTIIIWMFGEIASNVIADYWGGDIGTIINALTSSYRCNFSCFI